MVGSSLLKHLIKLPARGALQAPYELAPLSQKVLPIEAQPAKS